MGGPGLCSGPGGGGCFGEVTCGVGGGGSPPAGGVWRQAGEAGCCHFGWGRVVARVGGGRNGYLGADEARPLVTDMLQGGSDVNLLHSWVGGARGLLRGCPEEGKTPKA